MIDMSTNVTEINIEKETLIDYYLRTIFEVSNSLILTSDKLEYIKEKINETSLIKLKIKEDVFDEDLISEIYNKIIIIKQNLVKLNIMEGLTLTEERLASLWKMGKILDNENKQGLTVED